MINELTLMLYKLIIWLFFDNSVTYIIETHQQPIPQNFGCQTLESPISILNHIM